MKRYCVVVAGTVLMMLVSSFKFAVSVDEEVSYPAGYRAWTHVKSTILGPQHPNVNYRGFNHVYANALAMRGYPDGKFPEGSVFVLEVIATVPVENYTSEAGRHHMDVIQKDSLKFASTGGWGYAQFEGDNSRRMLTLEQKKACNACHLKQEDHVFSVPRKIQ